MKLKNKYLGINETNINDCNDKVTLLEWNHEILKQRFNMRQELSDISYTNNDRVRSRKIALTSAYGIQGLILNCIQMRLSELKMYKQEQFEKRFISICRDRLTDDTFILIKEEAENG